MERDATIAEFQSCTGIGDLSFCISLLDAHDWNLHEAVTSALALGPSDTSIEMPQFDIDVNQPLQPYGPISDNPSVGLQTELGTPDSNPTGHMSFPPPRVPSQLAGATGPFVEIDSAPLPAGPVRILHFDIELTLPTEIDYSDDAQICRESFTYPETETIESLKQHFVERRLAELTLMATSPQWSSIITDITPSKLTAHLAFDNVGTCSFDNNLITLRELHLPKFNQLHAKLVSKPPQLKSSDTTKQQVTSTTSSSTHIELHIHLHPAVVSKSSKASPARRSSQNQNVRHALRLRPDWRVDQIRTDVAGITGVPTGRQSWLDSANLTSSANVASSSSTSTSSTTRRRSPSPAAPATARLLTELRRPPRRSIVSNGSPRGQQTSNPSLAELGLKPGIVYTLHLTESAPKSNDRGLNPSRVRSPNRRIPDTHSSTTTATKPIDLTNEFDDDDDIDMGGADMSDDALEVIQSNTTSPWTTPLMTDSRYGGDPGEATEQFYQGFLQRYCTDGETMAPPFVTCSLDAALASTCGRSAVCERKPLFIYLHNDESVACHLFCQRILCSTGLTQFLGEHEFSLWPWDVTRMRAKERLLGWLENRLPKLASVITPLTDDSYPVLAMVGKLAGQIEVLCVVLGTGATLISSIKPLTEMPPDFPRLGTTPPTNLLTVPPHPTSSSGSLKADSIVAQLWQAFTNYTELLGPELAVESERLARLRVLEEQEEAFQQSLYADKLKEEMKAACEASEKMERERQEAALLREKSEATQHRLHMAAILPAEPPAPNTAAGEAFLASPKGAAGIASLRFRVPRDHPASPSASAVRNGFLSRRFAGQDRLRSVIAFIESQGFSRSEYKLLTTYPRRDLTALDENATVAEVKLVPQETLILEQR